MELNIQDVISSKRQIFGNLRFILVSLILIDLVIIGLVSTKPLWLAAIIVAGLSVIPFILSPEFGVGFIVNGLFILTFSFEEFGISGGVALSSRILCLVGLISYAYKNKIDWSLFVKLPTLLVLFLGILLFLSRTYSPSPNYGLLKTLRYFIFNAFIFCSLLFFKNNLVSYKKILSIISIFGVTIVVIAGIESLSKSFFWITRFSIIDINPIWFSRMIGLSILCLLFELRIIRRKSLKFIILLFLPLMIFFMISSGSRGPLLSLFIAFVCYFFVFSKLSPSRKIMYSLAFAMILMVIIDITPEVFSKRFFQIGGRDITSNIRKYVWGLAQRAFMRSPILGIGTGGFSSLIAKRDTRWYPHNIFLEIALENGILGLVTFVSFIIITLWYGLRIILNRFISSFNLNLAAIALAIFVFGFLNAQVSGDVTMNTHMWFASGMIVSIYFSTDMRKDQNSIK